MITVAHIITALGSGGAERVLYLVATRSPADSGMRHVVYSLAGEGMYGPELRRNGVEVHCLGMRRGSVPLVPFLSLVRQLRDRRPDVIMTWLYHADLLGSIAGRLAGVGRIVWNLRCSDFNFAQHPTLTKLTVKALAVLSRLPSAVVANSVAGRKAHEALGYHPRRWLYLPNGFDMAEWKPDAADRGEMRRKLGLADTDFAVGRIGRVDPQKDYANFIAAMQQLVPRHPALRVVLVGAGTHKLELPAELRARTLTLGERKDIPHVMRALDALVSSSAYGEGLPNVIGEAMAAGVPCVATDVGDSAYLVGDAGLIVPARDAGALADAVEKLMELPPAERADMAARGRERVAAEFSLDRCLQRYAEVLRREAGRRHVDGANNRLA
jgi:glycosyltransferase involved in cell wall biosynthesis